MIVPVPTGYNEIELPAMDEPLQAGDIVDLEYPFLDQGTWIESYHINKIEKAFEDDGRVRLNSYVIDRDKQLIMFRVEVLSNNIAQTNTPASSYLVMEFAPIVVVVTLLVITALIESAVITWLIIGKRSIRLSQKAIAEQQRILNDPNSTPEQKEVAKEILEAAKRGEEPTTQEAVVAASWAIGLLAGVVIVGMILKR